MVEKCFLVACTELKGINWISESIESSHCDIRCGVNYQTTTKRTGLTCTCITCLLNENLCLGCQIII